MYNVALGSVSGNLRIDYFNGRCGVALLARVMCDMMHLLTFSNQMIRCSGVNDDGSIMLLTRTVGPTRNAVSPVWCRVGFSRIEYKGPTSVIGPSGRPN